MERELLAAAFDGDAIKVAELLAKGVEVNCKDEDHFTPLHRSVIRGRTEVAKMLLQHGADANYEGKSGNRPLHNAAFWGFPETTKILIEFGAKVNSSNDNGDTPLHMAALNGRTEVSMVLLDSHAGVDSTNKDGRTPLHDAVYYGHHQCAKVLLQAGGSIHMEDVKGETVYDKVAARNRPETLAMLNRYLARSVNGKKSRGLMMKLGVTGVDGSEDSSPQGSTRGSMDEEVDSAAAEAGEFGEGQETGSAGRDEKKGKRVKASDDKGAEVRRKSGEGRRGKRLAEGSTTLEKAGLDALGVSEPGKAIGPMTQKVLELEELWNGVWSKQRDMLQALQDTVVRTEVHENVKSSRIDELEAELRELRAENGRFRGDLLETLDMSGLEELEKLHHEGIRRVGEAKVALLLRERAALERRHICVSCKTKDIDTVLLPCRHRCLCSGCAGETTGCPVCAASITQVIGDADH